MILVDTSIWIDHLRQGDEQLVELLNSGLVLGHPLVLGELACGNLRNRQELLGLLKTLPQARTTETDETLHFLETAKLFGLGLGWVDVSLLASAQLTGCQLLTRDRTLARAATRLGSAGSM
ncbi:MAG: PIN domain-containing protein [Candidatus Delongbacteria bacterium]|nr:PIN domain-containing protein [Candidatus Cloacimonadota bacterium]MCB9474845.1 PIN domain-containing protein [Candidatus Delongbacteria bacterium]